MYCRLFRASDFPVCAPLVEPGFQVPAELRAALPSLWHRLFVAGQLHGGVVVDPDIAGPESIVAFSMCVFVDEAFVTDYLQAPSPYPAALLYEQMLAGQSPVLATKDLPASNASGNMNLLILHFRIRHPMINDDRARAVVDAFQSSFLLFFKGYRMKRVLQEAYGAAQLPFFTAGGFLLKSDYGSHVEQDGVQPPPGELRPYLMGVYRDDPHTRYLGTQTSYLFQWVEPRFHFSAAEQRVLLRALMDESDETISDALAISHDAVKKTWRRIHDRVVDVVAAAAELFDDVVDVGTTRGKEKRRRLLHYIRYHLHTVPRVPWFVRPRAAAHAAHQARGMPARRAENPRDSGPVARRVRRNGVRGPRAPGKNGVPRHRGRLTPRRSTGPALRHDFRHESCRPGQDASIRTVLDGQDLLAVMFTASGRSLGFQTERAVIAAIEAALAPAGR